MATNKVLSSFWRWQQDSKQHIARPSEERHHCQCCESDFIGNFCPQCGQKAGVGRITWATLRRGIAMLWGMDSRSLPYTIWQLLLRPGYLIGDYISGKRQVSFPPIKMLAIVALFVFIIVSVISPEDVKQDPSNDTMVFGSVFSFFDSHYDVAVMFFLSMLIIPTYFIFRFAPRYGHLNLPEVFFIQVFNSTIILLWFVLFRVINTWSFDSGNVIPQIFLLIMCLTVYRSYYQLFGYSHWSTLWRIVAVILAAGLIFAVLVEIDIISFYAMSGNTTLALRNLTNGLLPWLLGAVIAIALPYIISRRTAMRRIESGTE